MSDYQNVTVSLKKNTAADAENAYTVKISDAAGTRQHRVHTGPKGRGLWIDGKQVEGNLQFSAGMPSVAILANKPHQLEPKRSHPWGRRVQIA